MKSGVGDDADSRFEGREVKEDATLHRSFISLMSHLPPTGPSALIQGTEPVRTHVSLNHHPLSFQLHLLSQSLLEAIIHLSQCLYFVFRDKDFVSLR